MTDANQQALVEHVQKLQQSRGGAIALCEAARWNLPGEVKRLLDGGVDPNARDDAGRTPLMYASARSMADLLLRRGADVNAKDDEGATALIWYLRGLAKEAHAAPYIQALLKAGADPTCTLSDGTSGLDLAEQKYGERVTRLLKAPDLWE